MLQSMVGQQLNWSKTTYYCMMIYLLLCTLGMWYRSDFPNLMIAIAGLYYYLTAKAGYLNHRKFALAVLISEIYDIIWLSIYCASWASGLDRDEGIEDGIRVFTLILTILNFLFKIVLAILFWKNSVKGIEQSVATSSPYP